MYMKRFFNTFIVGLFVSLLFMAQPVLSAGGFISIKNRLDSGDPAVSALSNGQTFTGIWETNSLNDVAVNVFTDQSGILYVDFSPDKGVSVDETHQFSVDASVNESHILFKGPRSVRLRFENDSGANQTEIRLNTYFGEFENFRHPISETVDDNEAALLARTFPLDVMMQQGLQRGYDEVDKFGSNLTISSTEETVRSFSTGRVVYPDVGGVALTISSGDVDDTSAGAGARTVTITWHDVNNIAQETTISMGGQSAAAIGTGIRSYRIEVLTVGATGSNEGILYVGSGTVTAGVPAVIYSTVAIGENQTEQAFFTIPAGKTGYMHNLHITSVGSGNADAIVRLLSRKNLGQADEPFVLKRKYVIGQDPVSPPGFIDGPYPAGTDVEITAQMTSGGGSIAAEFKMLLVDDQV